LLLAILLPTTLKVFKELQLIQVEPLLPRQAKVANPFSSILAFLLVMDWISNAGYTNFLARNSVSLIFHQLTQLSKDILEAKTASLSEQYLQKAFQVTKARLSLAN
jgi:hypothetical protein